MSMNGKDVLSGEPVTDQKKVIYPLQGLKKE